MCSNYGMPQLVRTVSKRSQVVLMATGPGCFGTGPARGFCWPDEPRRAEGRLARVVPADAGQVASGLPVTLGPGSPADGPEHGPPRQCHGQPAVSASGDPRPAQPLLSSR